METESRLTARERELLIQIGKLVYAMSHSHALADQYETDRLLRMLFKFETGKEYQ